MLKAMTMENELISDVLPVGPGHAMLIYLYFFPRTSLSLSPKRINSSRERMLHDGGGPK
jgi:hypothetical protein